MKRRALIICCNDTGSGPLPGAVYDNNNMRSFLTSSLGGNWYDNEIISLQNPTRGEVEHIKNIHFNRADYTFFVYSGHGYIDPNNNHQYLELIDNDIPLNLLKSAAPRQTMIIDACRGYHSPNTVLQGFGLGESAENFIGQRSTRAIFDTFVKQGDRGITVLYSAQQGQSAIDTAGGGAYICSLISSAYEWGVSYSNKNGISLLSAHERAKQIIQRDFPDTIQIPTKNREKRKHYFPFAVKR